MKKLFNTIFLLALCQVVVAQCASYQSAFPPPYPSTYPCLQTVFTLDSYCCSGEFDAHCISLLRTQCDADTTNCIFEQCKSTGCVGGFSQQMPFCPNPAPAYSSNNPPPGPNPPLTIDGILFELMYANGICFSQEWFNYCTWDLDSLTCLSATTEDGCNDNNPNTIDGVSSLLGCTHTPIPTGTSPYVEVKVKILLEGAYIAGSQGLMRTDLRTNNLLPISQPFSGTPWFYAGTESVATASAIPTNAVDWVLIELRNTLDYNCVVGRGAGILLSNGQVRSISSPTRGVRINNAMPNSNYYVVVRSRNHAPVMSGMHVFCSSTIDYDFSYDEQGAKGVGQQKLLENYDPSSTVSFDNIYFYGMKAGDFNNDGSIKTTTNPVDSDFMAWKSQASAIRQYNKADFNYDMMVTQRDYNLLIGNSSHTCISYVVAPNPPIGTCVMSCN
jgi:hypothetical protein